jgi:sigma-B regulation protein RsbQ
MLVKEVVLSTYNVTVSGQGSSPMLFAHGLGCDHNVWQQVAAHFEADYQVIVFDYIGSGGSDLSRYNRERYASLNGYAEDILDIIAALGLKEVLFVGHSVSSMIGMLAAIKAPHLFSKLVMIGPSPYYINEPHYMGGFDREDIQQLLSMMENNYEQWSQFFAPKAMGNNDKPELAGDLQELFCKADPVITTQFAKVTFLSDNRKDLSHLEVPVLILQPSEDIVAPQHIGEYIHQHIRSSTLCHMKATGHFPHLSAVEETVSSIKKYLGEKE